MITYKSEEEKVALKYAVEVEGSHSRSVGVISRHHALGRALEAALKEMRGQYGIGWTTYIRFPDGERKECHIEEDWGGHERAAFCDPIKCQIYWPRRRRS